VWTVEAGTEKRRKYKANPFGRKAVWGDAFGIRGGLVGAGENSWKKRIGDHVPFQTVFLNRGAGHPGKVGKEKFFSYHTFDERTVKRGG